MAARGDKANRDTPRGRALLSSAHSTALRSARSSSAVGPFQLSELVEELAEHLVVSFGVLADIESRHVEPEGPDKTAHASEQALGDGLASIGAKRVAQQPELVDEFLHTGVVLARHMRGVTASRDRVLTSRWRM